ncbi:hypothetical protein PBPRB0035 [Photobacterium profundum SS9]|uniref:Uncharacterized protein n=1 Tax=Photobacterium profundum (strain SS9) TaxID=298386 RepID=Q6LL67_PHOPR|nr:hypothetical protein PBPRB0035 [Photobacterium profundum SS9]
MLSKRFHCLNIKVYYHLLTFIFVVLFSSRDCWYQNLLRPIERDISILSFIICMANHNKYKPKYDLNPLIFNVNGFNYYNITK